MNSNTLKPILITDFQGRKYAMPHIEMTVKVKSSETNGQFAAFEEVTEPGHGTPLHTHEEQWEMLQVVEGTYKIRINDEVHSATAGSVAIVPPKTPHQFLNISETPSKMKFILSPGLNFEGFVAEMSSFKDFPAPDQLVALLEKYGMKLLVPPMTV